MPDDVRKEVERVLARFDREPSNGAEYNSLYDYLDFVTTLKWQPDKTPKIDLAKARKIMDRDHYGLKKVKERILQHLAVMALHEANGGVRQKGTILLLVGAPGTGKTSMGRSVAEALGRKYGKTPAQVILRWHTQMGFAVIHGSRNVEHIRDNLDILDFTLTDGEMEEIAGLDRGVRYYHRTEGQLVQFAGWRPAFEET